jgi:glycosyltransferase involved in cell wall biosynthesis
MTQAAAGGGPTLSVIIPCYNERRFIAATLASLFAQTRPPDEIIVVDDASTDDSAAIVKALRAGRPGLQLVLNATNRGGVVASMIGFAASRGDYVYFLAANDIALPDFFARSLAMLEAHPSAGLCSALCWQIAEDGTPRFVMPTPLVSERGAYLPPDAARRLLAREGNWIVGSTSIYRAEALRAIGGFSAQFESFSDAFVGPAIAARDGACFLPEPLAAWRQHAGSLAASVTSDPARVLAVLAAVATHGPAVAPELFTPAYLRRLLCRARFESAAAILRAGKKLPPGFDRLAGLPAAMTGVLGRLAGSGRFGRRLALAIMFMWLRPFDILAVQHRRAQWRRRGKAIIGKGFPLNLPTP